MDKRTARDFARYSCFVAVIFFFWICCGRVRGDTFKDRIWLWSNLASVNYNSEPSNYHFPLATDTQPHEAADYLGIRNIIMVEHDFLRPAPDEFQKYYDAYQLGRFEKIMWFIVGPRIVVGRKQNSFVTPGIHLASNIVSLVRSNQNITGFMMDDLFAAWPKKPPVTVGDIAEWQRKCVELLPARVHRNLACVLYDHDIARKEKEWKKYYEPYLRQVDTITLWFDYQNWLTFGRRGYHDPLPRDTDAYLEENLSRLEEKIKDFWPRPKIVLGCYMWQFLSRDRHELGYRDDPGGTRRLGEMLEFARLNVLRGRLHDIIFLASPVVKKNSEGKYLPAIEYVKKWIAENRDTTIGPFQNWLPNSGAMQGAIWSSPVAYNIGEIPYVLVGSGQKLHAFNRKNGNRLWSREVGDAIFATPAVGPNGDVYAATTNGVVMRLNGATGEILNQRKLEGTTFLSSPVLRLNGKGEASALYFGSAEEVGKLYSFTPDYLVTRWSHEFPTGIRSTPALGHDGMIYCASVDSTLMALRDETSGAREKWKMSLGGAGSLSSSPALGLEGKMYIGTADGFLVQISGPDENRSVSRFALGNGSVSSPVIADDGTVFVGAEDGNLYAVSFDEKGPVLKWKFESGGPIRSAPAIAADGSIYFTASAKEAGGSGTLYAVFRNGALRWKYQLGKSKEAGEYSSPLIDNAGTVFSGSSDGQLRAFRGDRIWMRTSWSKFKANPEGTGGGL